MVLLLLKIKTENDKFLDTGIYNWFSRHKDFINELTFNQEMVNLKITKALLFFNKKCLAEYVTLSEKFKFSKNHQWNTKLFLVILKLP